MLLLLDSAQVPGYDHRVVAQGQIDSKDLSGDSSSTGTAHGGWKAWLLQVHCKVDFTGPGELAALRRLFQQTAAGEIGAGGFAVQGADDGGAPQVFEISEPTAEALGIYKVRFTEQFRAEPDAQLQRWEVVFTLQEVRSIPEKKEERAAASPTETPGTPPGTQTPAGAAPSGEPEGWLLEKATQVDKLLGKYVFGTDETK